MSDVKLTVDGREVDREEFNATLLSGLSEPDSDRWPQPARPTLGLTDWIAIAVSTAWVVGLLALVGWVML